MGAGWVPAMSILEKTQLSIEKKEDGRSIDYSLSIANHSYKLDDSSLSVRNGGLPVEIYSNNRTEKLVLLYLFVKHKQLSEEVCKEFQGKEVVPEELLNGGVGLADYLSSITNVAVLSIENICEEAKAYEKVA